MSKSPSKGHSIAEKLHTERGANVLAERWLAHLFGTRIDALVVPADAAAALHELLSGLAASESAPEVLLERAEAVAKRFESEQAKLGEVLPEPLPEAALALARRPHQPHRNVVLEILDREPVRQLVRALLMDALVEFGRKMASPISGSRVGKGLGALGSLAGAVGAGVLGAVGGELEKQVERKASEFADSALSRVLQNMVEMVTDPRKAREQGELRAAIIEGALEVPLRLWVSEWRRADPRALIGEAQKILREFVSRDDARELLQRELEHALKPVGERTVRDELQALGVLEVAERAARPLLVAQIRGFDWAAAFEALD